LNPNKPTPPGRYALNMTLAAVAGQVGCLTIVLIVAALLLGMWLDNTFGTRPLFIVGLLLASVPVTLIAMFWVVRQATSRIKPDNSPQQQVTEETDRGTTS
jgi:F0F1-type ATP synthase assembly protein I